MTKKSPEKIQTIRDMAPGSSATEIAREIGVSLCTILKWGEEEGVRFLTKAQASKKAWADPEVRARMSQAHKKAWADPEVRARMSQASKKALADPEVRARMSQAIKKALADPEVRARMSQAHKKALADPEVRARMSQARKKAWADPEVRARMSQARKKAMADPEVRARIVTARAGAKGVEIPKWVPVDLWDEFAEIAALNGEEAAASHCRRLKHDAQAFA